MVCFESVLCVCAGGCGLEGIQQDGSKRHKKEEKIILQSCKIWLNKARSIVSTSPGYVLKCL